MATQDVTASLNMARATESPPVREEEMNRSLVDSQISDFLPREATTLAK